MLDLEIEVEWESEQLGWSWSGQMPAWLDHTRSCPVDIYSRAEC